MRDVQRVNLNEDHLSATITASIEVCEKIIQLDRKRLSEVADALEIDLSKRVRSKVNAFNSESLQSERVQAEARNFVIRSFESIVSTASGGCEHTGSLIAKLALDKLRPETCFNTVVHLLSDRFIRTSDKVKRREYFAILFNELPIDCLRQELNAAKERALADPKFLEKHKGHSYRKKQEKNNQISQIDGDSDDESSDSSHHDELVHDNDVDDLVNNCDYIENLFNIEEENLQQQPKKRKISSRPLVVLPVERELQLLVGWANSKVRGIQRTSTFLLDYANQGVEDIEEENDAQGMKGIRQTHDVFFYDDGLKMFTQSGISQFKQTIFTDDDSVPEKNFKILEQFEGKRSSQPLMKAETKHVNKKQTEENTTTTTTSTSSFKTPQPVRILSKKTKEQSPLSYIIRDELFQFCQSSTSKETQTEALIGIEAVQLTAKTQKSKKKKIDEERTEFIPNFWQGWSQGENRTKIEMPKELKNKLQEMVSIF